MSGHVKWSDVKAEMERRLYAHACDKLADRFDINRAQVLTATGNRHSWYAHPPQSTFWRNFPTWNEAYAYATGVVIDAVCD